MALATSAFADIYPSRPIKLVVPSGPGSGSDLLGRVIASELSRQLNSPVIIENKPGANTTLAATVVAKAMPDGYTLLLGTGSALSAASAGLAPSLAYDSLKDFSYISLVGQVSFVLLTSDAIKVRSFRDFIEYVQGRPGAINWGSGNPGGIAYMSFLKSKYDLSFSHIPYKSAPEALTGLLRGDLEVAVLDIPTAAPYVANGRLRPIAVTSNDRSLFLPNVPTFQEEGVTDIPMMDGWWVLAAPAGVSDDILDKLNAATTTILNNPSVQVQINRTTGSAVIKSTRASAKRFVVEQIEVWRKIISITPGLKMN